MSSERIELQSSVAVSAGGTTPFVPVPRIAQAAVQPNITALDSGATIKFYLVGSADGKTTSARIPVTRRTNFDKTTALATEQTEIGDRLGSAASLPEQALGVYDALPWDFVALEWTISGGAATATFSANLVGL